MFAMLAWLKHGNIQNRPRRQQDSRWSYLVCACATFCQSVNMGKSASFGVLFPVILKRFNLSRQETAWIGSLSIALIFLAGPVAARLTEKISCRFVTIIGILLCFVGLISTSFAQNFIIYYFTYSLMVGFGSSCIRTSSFLIVARYFHTWKPLATGILTAGAGLGLFIFAPLTQVFLDKLGLQNTFRILAGIVLFSGLPALAYDPNVEEAESQDSTLDKEDESSDTVRKFKIVDCSVWRVPTFAVFAVAFFLQYVGKPVLSIHLVKYAEEEGMSFARASMLLMYFGLTSCVSRIISGFICNLKFINPHFVYQVGSFIFGVSVILFTTLTSHSWFVLLSTFSGLGQGFVIATSNLIFLTCVDKKRRASAFGLGNCLTSIPLMTSPPFAGFLADESGSYALAFYYAGAALLLSGLLPFILLCLKAYRPSVANEQELVAVISEREIHH